MVAPILGRLTNVQLGEDHRRRRLLGLAVLCLLGVAVLYVLAVHTVLGQRIDEKAVSGHPWERTSSGDGRAYEQSAVILIAALGLAAVFDARRRWRLLVVLGAVSLGAVLLSEILRDAVLDRPNLVGHNWLVSASYPSGHATAATTVAVVCLVMTTWPLWVRRLLALGVIAVTDGVVLFIPIHRPSDVLGGQFMAVAAISAALGLFASRSELVGRFDGGRWASSGARRLAVLEGVAVGWVVVALAVMTLLASRGNFPITDYGVGFPLSFAAVMVGAAGLLAVVEVAMSATGVPSDLEVDDVARSRPG
jgi:membrane-associated phospholipid phosphatase